jgi:hypothetical protein
MTVPWYVKSLYLRFLTAHNAETDEYLERFLCEFPTKLSEKKVIETIL